VICIYIPTLYTQNIVSNVCTCDYANMFAVSDRLNICTVWQGKRFFNALKCAASSVVTETNNNNSNNDETKMWHYKNNVALQ
jgi:hypothetical protein